MFKMIIASVLTEIIYFSQNKIVFPLNWINIRIGLWVQIFQKKNAKQTKIANFL